MPICPHSRAGVLLAAHCIASEEYLRKISSVFAQENNKILEKYVLCEERDLMLYQCLKLSMNQQEDGIKDAPIFCQGEYMVSMSY